MSEVSFRHPLPSKPIAKPVAVAQKPATLTAVPLPAPNPVPQSAAVAQDAIDTSFAATMGFRVALLMVFLRFGFAHEIISAMLGLPNTLVLFATIVAGIALTVMVGGVRQTLASTPGRWWVAFAIWFAVTVPFSTWISDSAHQFNGYWLNALSILFVIVGLVRNLKQFYSVMWAVALAGYVNVLTARMFQTDEMGRLSIPFGSIANSNDYAAHMLLMVPFFLFVALGKSYKFSKITSGAAIVISLYLIAKTGSRGGLVAFAAVAVYMLIRASSTVRFAVIAGVPLILGALLVILPSNIVARYSTLWSDQAGAADQGATESMTTREYLLKTSLLFTLEHPIFGVGVGQFANVEGGEARADGKHGAWQVPHNTYTEVSSEMGIPGFAFFIGAMGSTLLLLNRTYKRCRNIPRLHDAMNAAFCLTASFIGFGVAITFLSMAYSFYLPFLSGMAVALAAAVDKELAKTAPRTATDSSRPQFMKLTPAVRAPWQPSSFPQNF